MRESGPGTFQRKVKQMTEIMLRLKEMDRKRGTVFFFFVCVLIEIEELGF